MEGGRPEKNAGSAKKNGPGPQKKGPERRKPAPAPGPALRLATALGAYTLFFVLYLPANHWVDPAACRDLTIGLDRAIPLKPGWIIPFYLVYILLPLPAFFLSSRDKLARAAWAFLFCVSLCAALFFLFPVYVPRPEAVPGTWAGKLVAAVYANDRPVCGFPSLHVAAAFVAAFAAASQNRFWGTLFFVLAAATALSTLFVKQHVIADVAGGLAAAGLAWAASGLLLNHRKAKENAQ